MRFLYYIAEHPKHGGILVRRKWWWSDVQVYLPTCQYWTKNRYKTKDMQDVIKRITYDQAILEMI